MATIEQVARKAGVSVATVSRVLNNSDAVRQETKERVEEAISELMYTPNMLGRNLRRSESKLILAILPSISNAFYVSIIDGIQDRATKDNYNVLLCQTNLDARRELEYLNMLRYKLADGVITLDPPLNESLLGELAKNYPVVQASEYSDQVMSPIVSIDNRQAAFDATNALIEMGHKNIGLINTSEHFRYARDRERGFEEALQEAGLSGVISRDNDNSFSAGYHLFQSWMKEKISLDAVFAVSDILASGALKAASDSHLLIPQDLAIMGFDNIHLAQMTNPSLSTVSQPMYQMGQLACSILLDQIHHREVALEPIMMDYHLEFRESTGLHTRNEEEK